MEIESRIKKSIGNITTEMFSEPIETLGIDSIDLVSLRVELDQHYEKEIPDSVWLNMNSLSELIAFYKGDNSEAVLNKPTQTLDHQKNQSKSYTINMPQMALEGLSENWLFKEIGDYHWYLLCVGLGVNSFDLKDELGGRLYATFVRIRIESSISLNAFIENESLELNGTMTRFGNSMYFSENEFANETKKVSISMMTTFSTRGHDNSKLVKGQPGGILLNKIEEKKELPNLGKGYRAVRKNELDQLVLKNESFQIVDSFLFETEYTLNPYYDINGVNLLYFAAYPVINDFCESKFFNEQEWVQTANKSWAQHAYTVAKDVFYFNNANVNDTIIYRLNSFERIGEKQIKIQSSLVRKSDDALMARIFSIKELID